MPVQIPVGPYKSLNLDGKQIPYYLIPFDTKGNCQAPRTVEHLKDSVRQCTDVYLFSHGWNNDWEAATSAYEHFLSGYINMRVKNKLSMEKGYKPILVGIFWPSAILVSEDERSPKFLSTRNDSFDSRIADTQSMIGELASSLDSEQSKLFYESLQKEVISDAESKEIAEILCKHFQPKSDDVETEPMTTERLRNAWSVMETALEEDPFAEMWTTPRNVSTNSREIAELGQQVSVRNILRTLTVWQMKDRAGEIGRNGVYPLIWDILSGTSCKMHLIGHSYGTKVVMTAVCTGDLPRDVRSSLLLQGAVSHLCFAGNVDGLNKAGGFSKALSKVELPILATYSEHDFPLTRVFHLALRRSKDIVEAKALNLEKPPSIFSALGGYGPRQVGGLDETLQKRIPINDIGTPYDLNRTIRVIGLEATRTISGHGDISNPSTWWALYNLASSKN